MNSLTPELQSAESDNARSGYEVAAGLGSFYIGLVWSIFNAMLVANSIVVAAIGIVQTNPTLLTIPRSLLPIVGLLLCWAWYMLAKRARDYGIYYVLSARELEEHYLSPEVRTISRGGSFADGEAVSMDIGGKKTTRRLGVLARLVRGEWASYIVVVAFAVVYVVVLLQG